MAIVECIPNLSEGQRPEAIATIADALRATQQFAVNFEQFRRESQTMFAIGAGASVVIR
ncbi:MAG TPA: hypothetical protein VNJ02_14515 [Vicinamibacterales bacterium]|nr:hypothetical protein [Vicinamibacterales bacterium]